MKKETGLVHSTQTIINARLTESKAVENLKSKLLLILRQAGLACEPYLIDVENEIEQGLRVNLTVVVPLA